MNKLTMLPGIILGTAAIPTLAADSGEPVTLENQVLRLEIQQAPAPFLQRLVHKASGQAVVAGPAHKSLFSITLAKQDGSQETLDMRSGERIEHRRGLSRRRQQDRQQARHQVREVPGHRSDRRGVRHV